jgi:putative transposase
MGFCSKVESTTTNSATKSPFMNILTLLQPIQSKVSRTTFRQLSRIIPALIAMTGRVTMLGLSRWTEKGGSYRTIQRFFATVIPWGQVFWACFRQHLLDQQDIYLVAGDECVITKAGEKTYGVDRFFSGLLKRTVPGLSFFVFSLVSVKQRRSYPLCVEQIVHTPEEKAAYQGKKQAEKTKPVGEKNLGGRPKGSRSQNKAEVQLTPELHRIQKMLQDFLLLIQGVLPLVYVVLDGHFGNHTALCMVRQCGLQLISKLRTDIALFFPFTGPSPLRGPRPKLGQQLNVHHIPDEYLKESKVEAGILTRIFQMQMLHREFPGRLNVVIVYKTNLVTKAWAYVIFFSSDLALPYDQLIDYYSLRFQIEFNFRDAKQFWGLEDFMNVNQTTVTNAANLSLFLVNVSQVLMVTYRQVDPQFSVLDLKAIFRAHRYVTETIQFLPQKPDQGLVSQLFLKVAALGRIHPPILPFSSG